MSPRDEATLSAAERAALAGLESKAEADDPRLAAALRSGSGRTLPTLEIPPGLIRASETWMGPVLIVAGLTVMVLALSSATLIAVVGALLFVVGILLSAALVRSGLDATIHVIPGRQSQDHDQDHGEGPRTNV